ncbi:MAG: M20/M25/M40 family metallo-hydrolase [Oscillospiraceae bacterium]|nr:M20/M25/M40 family metallo-hydrolase [Oscillospiraceae bacterium]MDD4367853.1 M20/M25/M40 family metallo-hydrolase [Oscillospiraceae bacterium]
MSGLTASQEKQIRQLRHQLHDIAEPSGQEYRTRKLLLDFLTQETQLDVIDGGEWFYAAYRVPDSDPARALALRADFDALFQPDGSAAHLCGHDGHAAALCGVALLLPQLKPDRNVFLLFQPAEETGQGAKACLDLFKHEQIGRIYGAHNLPGYPLGQVYTRPGTFALASRGLTLRLTGRPAHAAYPEEGISPAQPIALLLQKLPELACNSLNPGQLALCTVIGLQLGQKAFGQAAATAELWLTLRAETDARLEQMEGAILAEASLQAAAGKLDFAFERQDVFPATVNHAAPVQTILAACQGEYLVDPMRWSEDFGWYLQRCPGAYFGIGAGEQQPALHSQDYQYPDSLLQPAVRAFEQLILA